jgi:hypothetical protein
VRTIRPAKSPTEEVDKAIRWAMDDLHAARAAHQLRPHTMSAEDVQRYEDALNGLLESRKRYT